MSNREEETIELESQPLNAEKKAEIFTSNKADHHKEKITPIGLTKEELMKYAQDPFWCRLRKILFALFWLLWASMFVGAFLIIHYVPSCPATSRLKWYQKESTAQLDLRDVFGNSYAMLANQENMNPFMNTFQTRTLLLPNIFNSTPETNDIVDHFALNTRFGSQEELSKAIQNLRVNHETNVIMDLNAATTSRDHEWFRLFKERSGKYANYYLVADSNFEGASNYDTEKVSGAGNLITKNGLPVLNLLNADVRAEFKAIFEKWGRLNIKGYRLLGGPYLLLNPTNKRVEKNLQLNQQLIKDWTKELRYVVSDGVLILQLDDQDAESYSDYFGTQEDPIADIVVNNYVSKLDISTSTSTIRAKLSEYINRTKVWNDDLANIGPWTGWLVEDSSDSRIKDDLLTCFTNILGYTLPRGMPLTRISKHTLHIGVPSVFFDTLKNFNNLDRGTYDNARIFAKLMSLRKTHSDSIMLGRTEFVDARLNGAKTDDVFTMIRSNDKQGLIVIANLKNGSKNITLDLDFNRHPRSAQVAASCKIKQGHLMGTRINLDQSFRLQLNETVVATFDLTN